MSYNFNFTLSTDLTSGVDVSQLHYEVESGITATFSGINISESEDSIVIVFADDLNTDQQSSLTTIVHSHVPVPLASGEDAIFTAITPINPLITNTTYKQNGVILFPGTRRIAPTKVKINGVLLSGTSYSVRIRDVTNDYQVAEGVFTNTSSGFMELSSLTNLSRTESQWNVETRVSTNSTAKINNITLFC
jgi:hypothetical protein